MVKNADKKEKLDYSKKLITNQNCLFAQIFQQFFLIF